MNKTSKHNLLRRICFTFLLCALPLSWAQNTTESKATTVGITSIAKWKGFCDAAFSLTFDDAFYTHYTIVAPTLNKYDLKGTFFLLTQNIGPTKGPHWGRYAGWEDLREMAAQGHEMGNHSVTHANLTNLPAGNETTKGSFKWEIEKGRLDILKNIPGTSIHSFAYPFTVSNAEIQKEVLRHHLFARSGGGVYNSSNLDSNERMNIFAKEMQFTAPGNRDLDYDLDVTQTFLESLEDGLLETGKWGVLLAHEVMTRQDINTVNAWNPILDSAFDKFAQQLSLWQKDGDLWVETMGTVGRYMMERNRAKATLVSTSAAEIVVSLEDGLEDKVFNVPLTVEISVNSEWEGARIKQGDQVKDVVTNLGKVVVDILPNGEKVFVQRLKS